MPPDAAPPPVRQDPLLRHDATGHPLAVGDRVRIVGLPDLGGLPGPDRDATQAVFAHLVGTYRKIQDFDAHGHAELQFVIRRGAHAGRHLVAIEPDLLRRSHPQRA